MDKTLYVGNLPLSAAADTLPLAGCGRIVAVRRMRVAPAAVVGQ